MIRYPWDRWLGKKRIVLRRGRDYRCQPHSMGVQVRNAAAARGVHVSVKILEGEITVRRID